MMTYFQPLRPGYLKLFCTPVDSFWCCTGTGMENHAKYGDAIYFHGDDSLYVNLFIPSTLSWKQKGLTVTQTTNYPDEPKTRLKLTVQTPTELTLKIRHPSWCAQPTLRVNGTPQQTVSNPGSFISINRTWRSGDEVEIELPMKLRTAPLPGTSDTVAIVYGPIVLAGKLGKQGLTPGADIIVNERTYGDMLNEKIDVPPLAGDPSSIVAGMKPVPGSPLTFTAPIPGNPPGLTFIPYFRMNHERYSVYWKVSG